MTAIKMTLKFFKKHLVLIAVFLSYLFFTTLYMGPSIWNCTDTLSGIGDNTGGPIWRTSLEPTQPLLGGFQEFTNYPTGESLYSPVGIVSVAQTATMRAVSTVTGPVCAYNIINIVGYLSTSITMFLFIAYLIKSKWIAWLAGYAVAFTPYAQSKVGGHPSYGYASILIALFWITLHIIKTRKWRFGVGLSFLLALCAYFDPYFILFAITILIPTLGFWVTDWLRLKKKSRQQVKDFKKTIKVFAVALAGLLILISPVVFLRIRDAELIATSTGAVRGNVELAAMECSNFPHDYLLPDPYNTNLVKVFGNKYTATNIDVRHWCGNGESRVSISLIVIFVSTIGLSIILWDRISKQKSTLNELITYNHRLVLGSVLLIATTAFLLGLPPRIAGVLMPSGLVIMVTETWRIFAREYLVLNMMLVVLFSIVLKYLHFSLRGRYVYLVRVIFVILSFVIMLEYQIHDSFRPFTFSFNRDVPQIYRTIKDNQSIDAIAEYPMDRLGVEADSIVYYTTMQIVHQKKLLNSAVPLNTNEKLHISIKDLSDPQTIPILRSLGIEYLVIHGLTSEQVTQKTNQLEILQEETPIVYGLTIIREAPTNTMVLAKIKEGPKLDFATVIDKGFAVNNNIMKSSVEQEYETVPDSELLITGLPNSNAVLEPVTVCFDMKMASKGDTSETSIIVNGQVKQTINLSDAYSQVKLAASVGDRISIKNKAMHNTRIDNLGCITR